MRGTFQPSKDLSQPSKHLKTSSFPHTTMSTNPFVKKRGFQNATRLEMKTGQLPPDEQRKLLVEEIQELVNETNGILMRRDGLRYSGRTKKQREEAYEQLAEQYAEKMVVVEEKHKELRKLEKDMKLPDLSV